MSYIDELSDFQKELLVKAERAMATKIIPNLTEFKKISNPKRTTRLQSYEAMLCERLLSDWKNFYNGEFSYVYDHIIKKYSECNQLTDNLSYHCGLYYYGEMDYDNALKYLDSYTESTRKWILLALSHHTLSPQENKANVGYFILYGLKEMETDTSYIQKEKSFFEEKYYVEGAIVLSEIYRKGSEFNKWYYVHSYRANPFDTLTPNTEKAYNLLTKVQSSLVHETNKKKMQIELSKYKKKLFGGYKYIG